jgi:plasmid maintenance system antidote protein VapI
MNLPLSMGAMNGEVSTVAEGEMRAATDFKSALALCIRLSRVRRTQNDLAGLVGINATQFSKIMNGAFHLPTDKIPVIEKLCGNTAITQWLASQHGAQLHYKTPEQIIAEQAEVIARLQANQKEAA